MASIIFSSHVALFGSLSPRAHPVATGWQQGEAMAKQIVVCMDGTWNDPIEQTNVYRLFQMLPGEEQQVEENGPIRSHLVKSGERTRRLLSPKHRQRWPDPGSCSAARRESVCTTA
jgi:hypothetical protein